MSDFQRQPEDGKHFDTRELILMLYASGGMFLIILVGLIGLITLGILLNSVILAIVLPLSHLAMCIGLIAWAFKDFKQNRP